MSRWLLLVTGLLLLCTRTFGADQASKETKPPDFSETVVAKAISFMPADLKAQLSACRKEIVSAARPEVGKADKRYGFAVKADEEARKAFAEAFGGVRKSVETGKSVVDLKVELGRVAQYVLAICHPYRADKAAFDSTERPAFEQKLDSLCSTMKADPDGFQRVADPARFALETSAKAQAEAKKLSAGGKKADDVPSVVFSLAANSLADVWQSLLTKPGTDGTGTYIGNKSSKKFHLATCRHLPSEKNQVRFTSRDDAVAAGYEPCKVCKP